MEFRFPDGREPQPGKDFHFGVGYSPSEPGGAPIHVNVHVDGVKVASLNCPDPPCHQLSVFILEAWDQAELELAARSDVAAAVTAALQIGSSSATLAE